MELEVRVLDEADFIQLKPHATYASEITKVMAFDSSVMRKGIPLFEKYFSKEDVEVHDKYIIDIDDKRKIFMIAPDSYLAFCGGSKPKGSSFGFIPIASIKEIYILIKYGLVEPTDAFQAWFSPVDKKCALSELHSFTNKKEFRGNKKWTFQTYFEDLIESGKVKIPIDQLTVANTSIFGVAEDDKLSIPVLHELRAKILDVNVKSAKALVEDVGKHDTYEITMYGWTPFKYSCWEPGKEIRLLYQKVYGGGTHKKIISPTVLPEDIVITNMEEFHKDTMLLKNRRYPSELFNRMYFEWKIRTIGNEGDI